MGAFDLDVYPWIATSFAVACGYVGGPAVQALEEGNPLDRAVFSVLILLALVILFSRSFNWGKFFANNFALMALLHFRAVERGVV